MKKILLSLGLCFMLVGCTNQVNYERSTEMATVINTNMNEVNKKIENKDTFVFMLTFDFCETCKYVTEEVLADYVKDHGFELAKVELSRSMSEDELIPVYDFIKKHPNPPEFLSEGQTETEPLAPSFYFIVDGEVKEIYINRIEENEFDEFIQKYQLDAVK